ncbi:transmembrane protein 179B-like isoform X2 [Conger conger]|uniref:transmembrane protein 179B-like isoform X2 n=1 Tax=Conger conger TaxID=82655 RepID=UPI002A5A4B65|nr:transmembrane protein 179B-like isoform X2 [Conger conger]
MALHWLLLVELGLYAGCFICGIIAAASVTITQGEFAGKCILYGTARMNGTNLTIESPSSQSLCYFVSAISVCVAVYCFSLTLYWVYTSCVDQEAQRGRLWMNVTLVICGVFLFFLLVTGCVLRIGRNRLCESIVSLQGINRCEEAQDKPWSAPYVGTRFFSNLHGAEWLSRGVGGQSSRPGERTPAQAPLRPNPSSPAAPGPNDLPWPHVLWPDPTYTP